MNTKLLKDLLASIDQARVIRNNRRRKICGNCKRELPNKSYRTKNGCYWCDVERARKGNK